MGGGARGRGAAGEGRGGGSVSFFPFSSFCGFPFDLATSPRLPTLFCMHRLRSCCVALLLGGAVMRAASPADWKLPPLDGELSGQIDSPMLGGAPKLDWKLTLATPRPRERKVEFLIEGVGARIR